MLKDDSFLKAGLRANDVLHSKRAALIGSADELKDEEVQRAMRR